MPVIRQFVGRNIGEGVGDFYRTSSTPLDFSKETPEQTAERMFGGQGILSNTHYQQVADRANKRSYGEAQALAQGSQAGAAILGQYADPNVHYPEGRGPANPGKPWGSNALGSIQQAMQEESVLLGKMKGQESAYDTAYTQALQGQEMAKTKTGVFQAGSAPETIIGGAQGAGIEKTGQFKSMYGAGSMLPASWMQSRLDPSKVAAKVSGLEDRNAPEQLKIGSTNLTYDRSKFKAPALKKSGLGKYAPLSQLAAL